MSYKQYRVTIGGKVQVSDENGKFVDITPEAVAQGMTKSPTTTGWAEDHRADRAAADPQERP